MQLPSPRTQPFTAAVTAVAVAPALVVRLTAVVVWKSIP